MFSPNQPSSMEGGLWICLSFLLFYIVIARFHAADVDFNVMTTPDEGWLSSSFSKRWWMQELKLLLSSLSLKNTIFFEIDNLFSNYLQPFSFLTNTKCHEEMPRGAKSLHFLFLLCQFTKCQEWTSYLSCLKLLCSFAKS